MGMKKSYIYSFAVALLMLCIPLCASTTQKGGSPVAEMLNSHKDAKKLDGTKLKIAKPFIKRTPMGIIMDEIHMMIICPMDLESNDARSLPKEAQKVLQKYNLVQQIDDEKSTMDIYIDTPKGDRFSEIILYNTKPEPSIMLFVGDFTVESLIKVGEASEEERKHLKKNK